ncbi:unnamed protein product [Bursaphelenchus okinawaensis]|uniref:Uncharacterized protein n=1 Tax=Bursaphelenchus okinawaensis TaxID=465554 RepID=A0A811KI38_9BILA|nr:unnamed protein product [Bursaphelenchus okinawaensis]CAD5215152.1 unnamed protein product [Bursaphelenchus okinawaensis]CAG9103632.1 unnamed protein product [Bursaphelenchus okinawaensis]CAG9103634.1 unnamed protein product [Bursaphelenchus okinawaensis]
MKGIFSVTTCSSVLNSQPDVDGLSRVPITYEDRFVDLHRQHQNHENAHCISESSSSGRESLKTENNQVLRRRIDSTMSFDMCEEDYSGRRKRDSQSSNLLFQVDMNTTSHFDSLNEEDTRKCDYCNTNVTMESNSTMTSSSSTLINGSNNLITSTATKVRVTCARCAANRVPIHSPSSSRMVVS